jgi:hypothetical protein
MTDTKERGTLPLGDEIAEAFPGALGQSADWLQNIKPIVDQVCDKWSSLKPDFLSLFLKTHTVSLDSLWHEVSTGGQIHGRLARDIRLPEKRHTWDQQSFIADQIRQSLKMADRRALIAKQSESGLAGKNARLSEENETLRDLNDELHFKLRTYESGECCLRETRSGVVSEKTDDQVEITYDFPEGPLKQVYDSTQFLDGKMPEEGDSVEARLTLIVVEKFAERDSSNDVSELPSFEDVQSPEEMTF